MKIGIPKETKVLEGRVGLIPQACKELVKSGHELYLQCGAGLLSGYADRQYADLGVHLVKEAGDLYGMADLIIKVKEPAGEEVALLEDRHLLFCFLHLAANAGLASSLQQIGLTALAFETVVSNGSLPLLAPMSDIAGRVAIQAGMHLLHQPQGGRGILLGGVPATERGNVVIIGAGVAGGSAAIMAAGVGANVTVFDQVRERLEHARTIGSNITALYPYQNVIEEELARADLVIGAVLIPGARTPRIVTRDMIKNMKKRSVIIDISVDQGGCVETIRPTTYKDPTYITEEVLHFGVTNLPGAVPGTASQALSAAILPYVERLASEHWEKDPELADAVNLKAGNVVHPVVKEALA
ncbi:MAG TPA: alanine dehydrogenase [Gammaproteobacteria bacterium]|nr:alanine dehydrogenase [Gammaproteobacteria bacterium]